MEGWDWVDVLFYVFLVVACVGFIVIMVAVMMWPGLQEMEDDDEGKS
jgi:hypothetical protein